MDNAKLTLFMVRHKPGERLPEIAAGSTMIIVENGRIFTACWHTCFPGGNSIECDDGNEFRSEDEFFYTIVSNVLLEEFKNES